MAHAPAAPPATPHSGHAAPPAHTGSLDHQAPVTAGKVAMWLFLATEVMFFTGLIGSYIVLRIGSPETAYSNFFAPGTDLSRLMDTKGVTIKAIGSNASAVAEIMHHDGGLSEEDAHHVIEAGEGLGARGLTKEKAEEVLAKLQAAGAEVELANLETFNWPRPYHTETNPLSIDLTAANTFVLICSSVTMVLALGAIQQGNKKKLTGYLLATTLIGSCFLGVQVYEYYQLMEGHHYPIGISATGHFRPSVSLFASCFFTMTGFHGMHVFGGVVMLACLLIGSLFGAFTRENHASVELVGLYWHFVDLVWIILFTIVYLI
ncbi:MAG: cytochrome c oxidase subunit 3 [Isosphaeraceae bacterium]